MREVTEAHCTFSSSVPIPFCPSAQADRHRTESPRMCHSCGVAGRPVTGVLCGRGQNDRQSALSCVTAAPDHGQPHAWRRKAFPCVTALLGPLWDLRGKRREECGRRWRGRWGAGAQRLADLQITHGKKTDRFDMRTCPHLCSGGKGHHQCEPVNAVTPHS